MPLAKAPRPPSAATTDVAPAPEAIVPAYTREHLTAEDAHRQAFKMAFTDAHGVWAYVGAAGPRLVLARRGLEMPRVAPDGWSIAVTAPAEDGAGPPGSPQLLVVPWTGGTISATLAIRDVRDVERSAGAADASGRAASFESVRWFPDSRRIALATAGDETEPFGALPNHDLWAWDSVTRQLRDIAAPGEAWTFSLSPDGATAAMVGPAERARYAALSIVATASDRRQRLLEWPTAATESEWSATEVPLWTDGGRKLVVATIAADEGGEAWWVSESPVRVYEVTVAAGKIASWLLPRGALWMRSGLVGSYGLNARYDGCTHLAGQTADASWLATVRGASGSDSAYPGPYRPKELVITDLHGGDGHTIAAGSDIEFLGWSPARRAVLYRSGEALYIQRLDSASGLRLQANPHRATAVWASDTDVACLEDGRLTVEAPYEPDAGRIVTLVASGVGSFDVVPGSGTCNP